MARLSTRKEKNVSQRKVESARKSIEKKEQQHFETLVPTMGASAAAEIFESDSNSSSSNNAGGQQMLRKRGFK